MRLIRRLLLTIVVPGVTLGAMAGGALGAPAAQAHGTSLANRAPSTSTAAGPQRVTRGDAQAVFEAGYQGGWAIFQHSSVARGAPADFFPASIRPFSGSPWDGAHFCAGDWHVIMFNDVEGGGTSFTRDDAARIMNGLDVTFTLDGAVLPTTRTAIKRFTAPAEFGVQKAYAFGQGRIMSPADLSIGSHQLQITVIDAAGVQSFQDGITFFIDAPGTGACI